MRDVIFNGVQEGMDGYPEHWVFTDLRTGGTFYTPSGITGEGLAEETTKFRERFLALTRKPDGDPDQAIGTRQPMTRL